MLNELPLYRDTFELVSLVTDYIDAFPMITLNHDKNN